MMNTTTKYLRPSCIAEAIEMANENIHSFVYLAGGTDVIVNQKQGTNRSTCMIDITGIQELRCVLTEGGYLKIGSLIRLDELKTLAPIREHLPALIEAAEKVASPTLRQTATIGGNVLCENRCIFYNQSEWWRQAAGYCLKCDGTICIATGGKKACFSKFVSDTAPVLISADAMIEVFTKGKKTTIPLEQIYTGDGISHHNLPRTSLIGSVLIPLDGRLNIVFKKLRPRQAVDFTSLSTAVSVNHLGRLKIVIGGVDPRPVVIEGTIHGDLEEYIRAAVKRSRIVDNDYYSRVYRREMIGAFLKQSFEALNNQHIIQ